MKQKEQKTRDSSALEVGQVRRQHTFGVLRNIRHESPFRDLERPFCSDLSQPSRPLESDAKTDPESSLSQVTPPPPRPNPLQPQSCGSDRFLFLFDRKPFGAAPFAEGKRLVDLCRSVEMWPRCLEKEVSNLLFSCSPFFLISILRLYVFKPIDLLWLNDTASQ